MPLYDYECNKCGHVFEVFHKINETPDLACPKCKSGKPSKVITQAKTDTWSKFLDNMEKRVNPHKFRHNLKEI